MTTFGEACFQLNQGFLCWLTGADDLERNPVEVKRRLDQSPIFRRGGVPVRRFQLLKSDSGRQTVHIGIGKEFNCSEEARLHSM
jgi:hypothetical protein